MGAFDLSRKTRNESAPCEKMGARGPVYLPSGRSSDSERSPRRRKSHSGKLFSPISSDAESFCWRGLPRAGPVSFARVPRGRKRGY